MIPPIARAAGRPGAGHQLRHRLSVTLNRPTSLPILALGMPDKGFSTHRVTQRFSTVHPALDIGNHRPGDAIVAPADGIITATGYLGYPWSAPHSGTGTGNFGGLMTVTQHARNLWSVNAHLQSVAVRAGQKVSHGQLMARIGETGYTPSGPHLHYAVIVATGEELDGLRRRLDTVPYAMCRDPWPFPKTFAEAMGETMQYTFQLDVWQLWSTIAGRPFYTLDGKEKEWATPVETLASVCEIRLENGIDARIVPYGMEMLLVPRASLAPINGGRVDPRAVQKAVR